MLMLLNPSNTPKQADININLNKKKKKKKKEKYTSEFKKIRNNIIKKRKLNFFIIFLMKKKIYFLSRFVGSGEQYTLCVFISKENKRAENSVLL